ncbi:MAG: ABC transporter ATP-binding protein [Nocardioidaceae bacterium]
MSPPVVSFRGVSKRYGSVLAVDDVTLSVKKGQIYALLGLNGAGKTTLIRMLLGMVRPTAGAVKLAGRSLRDRSVWADVGYLVESPAAYPELTVRENLELVRRLRKVPARGAVDDAIEMFGLGSYADRRARTLSLGNAQRLGLGKALLHRPSLLVLDEPVNGLDPAGVVEVRALLADLARHHGMTVFLSSHLLGEVARLATRIGVLHDGRLVDEFDTDALSGRVHRRLEVSARDNALAAQVLRDAHHDPRPVRDGLVLDDAWAVRHPDLLATALVRGGHPPTRLAVVEEDLEEYFLRLVDQTAVGAEEVTGAR